MKDKIIKLQERVAKDRLAEAKLLRGRLFGGVRAVLDELDSDLSGYAIVAWSREGDMRSVYEAGGLIGPNLVPTLCADALNRHIARQVSPPSEIGGDAC